MFKVFDTQLELLGQTNKNAFIADMMVHLRTCFESELEDNDDESLRARIDTALDDARAYELVSRQDCTRYLNLAATYGWDFLDQPAHKWMKVRFLENLAISSPSERVRLLVAECIHRAEVEAADRRTGFPPAAW